MATPPPAAVADPPAAGVDPPATSIYSVWALPPVDVASRIKTLMSTLRSEFPSPAFEPHITLVGALPLTPSDALLRLRSAAASLSPYTARISSVARGSFFYQCVFLLIEPSPEVTTPSALCCVHFDYRSDALYMPHISVLYGDMTDEEKEKARVRAEEIDREICGLSFEVSDIALYKTDTDDKSLESWEKVEVCSLRK